MDGVASILTAWSYGLATVGYLLFVFYLLKRGYGHDGARARAMLFAVAMCVVWATTGLLFGLFGGFTFLSIGIVTDALHYGGWYAFLLALIRTDDGKATGRWLSICAIVLTVSGVVFSALRLLEAVPSVLAKLEIIHAVAMVVFAIVLLEQLLRNVTPDSRWNIKPIMLGLGGVFCFDLYLFSDTLLFNRLDPDLHAVRGFVHAAVIPLLGLSSVRGGAQLAKIRLSQKVVFQSTTLMLVGLYLLFMAVVGYYVRFFGGEWGRAMQYAVLFAALMILVAVLLSGSMRARIRVLIGKHFFRYRYDYREEWLRFTRALSAQSSLQGMGEQVIRGLADMVESPAGGVWLRDSSTRRFCQVARWNMAQEVAEEEENGSLCSFLRQSGWVINLEEFRSFSSRYRAFEIPEWLSQIDSAWLIVPLVAGNEMNGFVILARSRVEVEVDWEVNDLLRTAGKQAASFIAQVIVTEELIEARKFDAFNRMSAFVVHDLKNIVTQLSLLVRNAERHGDNPEFQQDMLMTVQHSVERMRQLMLQLRDGAVPAGNQLGVPLAEIARRIVASRAALGRSVELTIAQQVMARGHEDRIERVVGHAVQNALDATAPTGRVWVTVDRDRGRARVVVGDTGQGMTADFIKERLFRPFQTTKAAGMGIGAYESFQYIRSLGGDVGVVSEVGVGTTITMLFPLFDTATELGISREVTDGR